MEEKQRFSGVGWLSSRLSRKLIALILVLAVASWLAMCAYFLAYLGRYTGQAYDGMVESAQDTALRAAAYLEGCGGDYELFGTWLSGEGFGASVQTKEGERLFDQAPAGLSHGLTAGAWAPASLPGGTVRVAVQVPAMARQELTRSVTHSAFLGLLLLNLCVFAGAALLIFALMVAPIVRLRKTMRRYYESGTRPERTDRADEIGRLQNTFADLAGIVDRKEKAERQLIASISHDIKTPLTSVLGYSERLLSPGLPPEKERSYLQSVHEKAVAIQSIVDEFDDYIDVGLRDTAPMGLMTAEELCARLLQEYEGELADTGVDFRVDCQCPGDRLLCNWEHMRRFFGNLIGNSIQHAGRSGSPSPSPAGGRGARWSFSSPTMEKGCRRSCWTRSSSRCTPPTGAARSPAWDCPSARASSPPTAAPSRPLIFPAAAFASAPPSPRLIGKQQKEAPGPMGRGLPFVVLFSPGQAHIQCSMCIFTLDTFRLFGLYSLIIFYFTAISS